MTRGLPEIDGYTIEEQIGAGGFSKVYRATQHSLQRSVAVKVLDTNFEDERQQRTFERECRVMGQLSNHPNIVTVYDSALTARRHPCIIMELYRSTYRDRGVLDVAEVVDVGIKVADALRVVHGAEIVHRDIKPHNLFISDLGEPALGDFGISSVATERTITGSAGFSVSYAAPEVFEEAGAGASGDIYALGATLYHLASGEVPFPHTGDPSTRLRSTIHKIISSPAPLLERADAPDSLGRLLRRCMAKSVSDRPATAEALADELRRIQADLIAAGRRPAPVVPPSPASHAQPSEADLTSGTGSVTVARSGQATRLRADIEADEDERVPALRNRKVVLAAAGALALLIAGSAGVLVATGGGGDTPGQTPTPAATPTAIPSQQPPGAPSSFAVTANEDDTYELVWESPATAGEDVRFRVSLVEDASISQDFPDSPATWETDLAGAEPCFRIAAYNDVALTQGPIACASG